MSVYSDQRYIDMLCDYNYIAASNLFRIVSFAVSTNATGHTVVLATSPTDGNILGVLNNQPNIGETANVCGRNAQGTFKVVVSVNSAGVAVGDSLTVSADSGAITTTTTTNEVIGRALEPGVAGQVIQYLPINHKYGN
jgi:hypothetical protein